MELTSPIGALHLCSVPIGSVLLVELSATNMETNCRSVKVWSLVRSEVSVSRLDYPRPRFIACPIVDYQSEYQSVSILKILT
eukprot:7311216-Pyramimonas_sp.AAC.1